MDVTECLGGQLDELAAQTVCLNGHECIRSHFKDLTEVELAAEGEVLFCLGPHTRPCGHSLPFGRCLICLCPVRKYIAKKLNK